MLTEDVSAQDGEHGAYGHSHGDRPGTHPLRFHRACQAGGDSDAARVIQIAADTLAVESPAEPYQPTAVTVKAVVDSMGIYLTLRERHREEQQTRTVETVVEQEVNVLRWWQTALMWMGGVMLILLVAIVTARLLPHK